MDEHYAKASYFLLYSHLSVDGYDIRMVASSLWRGPDNIHGFALDAEIEPLKLPTFACIEAGQF